MTKIIFLILTLTFALPVFAQNDDTLDIDTEIHESKEVKKDTDKSQWSFILPVFVMHGEAPTGGANELMPRKLDSGGRFVGTPGFGFEYEGSSSFDFLIAAIKDCYDDYAGTFQFGQYFKLGSRTKIGYTAGLYIRQTPLTCYTSTSSQGGGGGGGGGLGGLFGGGGTSPSHPNTITTSQCVFDDNLPLRYTFYTGGQYIDIIPTPFLNFSTVLYRGSFDVNLKIISNFYLNEFGLTIPF